MEVKDEDADNENQPMDQNGQPHIYHPMYQVHLPRGYSAPRYLQYPGYPVPYTSYSNQFPFYGGPVNSNQQYGSLPDAEQSNEQTQDPSMGTKKKDKLKPTGLSLVVPDTKMVKTLASPTTPTSFCPQMPLLHSPTHAPNGSLFGPPLSPTSAPHFGLFTPDFYPNSYMPHSSMPQIPQVLQDEDMKMNGKGRGKESDKKDK